MNSVVYYPYLYPTSNWLKLAALCWDSVYTLASNDAPKMSPELRRLNRLFGGILKPVNVGLLFTPDIERQFTGWLTRSKDDWRQRQLSGETVELTTLLRGKVARPTIVNKLKRLRLLTEQPEELLVPEWAAEAYRIGKQMVNLPLGSPPPWDTAHPAWLEYERLSDAVDEAKSFEEEEGRIRERERFVKKHLVRVRTAGSVYFLPKEVALHYLSLCAAVLAERGYDLIADGRAFTDTVLYGTRRLRGDVVFHLLKAYIPKDLAQIDPHKIADHRAQFSSSRLQYQRAIQELVESFARVASGSELEHLKRSLIELARERVEETKQSFKRSKVEIALKAFAIGLTPPALLTAVASALGTGIFAPAGILASLGIFGATALLELNKAQAKKKESPWSYVLETSTLK